LWKQTIQKDFEAAAGGGVELPALAPRLLWVRQWLIVCP